MEVIKSLFVKKEEVPFELDKKLYKAILKKNTREALLYIDQGVRLTIEFSRGLFGASLRLAASRGLEEICSRLIKGGAKVNVKDKRGWTPLACAISGGHFQIYRLLLKNKAKVNDNKALIEAVRRGYLDICNYLIENGSYVNARDFFDDPDDPEDSGTWRTPLIIAAERADFEISKLLIEKGAEVNVKGKEGWTPLKFAAWHGHLGLCSLLLENGAKDLYTAAYYISALPFRLKQKHLDACKLFIEKGASVNAKTRSGATSLMLAAYNGHSNLCTLLLEEGAVVGMEDNKGYTAFRYAVEHGHLDACEAMVTHTIVVPVPVNVSESYERVYTALLCFKRLKIHKDVHRMILRSIGDLRKDLLQILLFQIKKGKHIPNVYIDIAADEILKSSKVHLRLLMGKVFKSAKTDEMREVLNPDLLELNFGDKIYENIKKALRENKPCLRIRHAEEEVKSCIVQ